MTEISVKTLKQKLQQGERIFLLDVREPHEYLAFNINGYLIPLNDLAHRFNEIPKDKSIVVYCRSGKRSAIAVAFLTQQGFHQVQNLAGGMLAWQEEQHE